MADSDKTVETTLGAIRHAGMRVTRPRREIIATLARLYVPATPREIHDALDGACDPVTVYRCLTEFEHLGLVHRHEFGDGSTRYQLVDPDGGHFHYIVCRRCQHAERIHACPPPELEAAVAGRGYSQITHTLEFFAICPDCRALHDQRGREE